MVNLYTDEVGNPEVPQKLRQAAGKKPIEKARAPVRSQRLLATICVSCTALVMSLRFLPAVPVLSQVWGHEQRLQDWLHRTGRRTATHPELVFVAISTKSLAGPEAAKAGKDRMLQLMASTRFHGRVKFGRDYSTACSSPVRGCDLRFAFRSAKRGGSDFPRSARSLSRSRRHWRKFRPRKWQRACLAKCRSHSAARRNTMIGLAS